MEEDKINFDIHKMIDSFDWYDFMSRGAHKTSYGIASGEECSNASLLLITNKQYILSYTEGYGQGVHYDAAARIIKDLHGGGYLTKKEAMQSHGCLHNYIWARIIFENGIGAISFMDLANLNSKNYELFCCFYNDYNETIKVLCNRYNFVVRFTYRDENKKLIAIESKSLDELLLFLQNHLQKDIEVIDDKEEIIIGRTIDSRISKR